MSVAHPKFEILAAMTRRGVNKACARIICDMIASENRDVELISTVETPQRMRCHRFIERCRFDITQSLKAGYLRRIEHTLRKLVAQDKG
jgi:hypothetical protein